MMTNTTPLDIDFRLTGAGQTLSNLAPNAFKFRGVQVAGMEGLLMGIKYDCIESQRHFCTLHGFEAKKQGRNQPWWETGTIHWDGIVMDRFGDEYQSFLTEAYKCLFDQNKIAREALLSTGYRKLEHSIGQRDPKRTILTVLEFVDRLTDIRDRQHTLDYLEF